MSAQVENFPQVLVQMQPAEVSSFGASTRIAVQQTISNKKILEMALRTGNMI